MISSLNHNTKLVVLLIKFPIRWITHSNSRDDSSVVVSTNNGTIGPYMVIATLEWNMQVWCSNNIQLIRPHHQLVLVERKIVTASFVEGHAVSYFFLEEPRSKGQNEVWTNARYSCDCRWWNYIWCGLFVVFRF